MFGLDLRSCSRAIVQPFVVSNQIFSQLVQTTSRSCSQSSERDSIFFKHSLINYISYKLCCMESQTVSGIIDILGKILEKISHQHLLIHMDKSEVIIPQQLISLPSLDRIDLPTDTTKQRRCFTNGSFGFFENEFHGYFSNFKS